jgi:hypothetical protein
MTLLAELVARVPAELLSTRDTAAIAAAVSVGRKRVDKSMMLSSLGLASRFPSLSGLPGSLASEMVLQKIEGLAVALKNAEGVDMEAMAARLFGATIERQMVHLKGQGMAFGDPAMHEMFDRMLQMGALAQEEVDALKSVALVDDPVSEFDVRCACWSDDGEWLV